jgi:signal transduction histidine kinase
MAGLRWLRKQFSKSTGISVKIQGQKVDSRLPRAVEMAWFRIIQEALNNVAKHPQASSVTVGDEVQDGPVRLIVADNGIGFDPACMGRPEGRHR